MYTVIHELIIPDAVSPEDAARRAALIQQDPNHAATFYTVIPDNSGPVIGVDLAQHASEQAIPITCQVPMCSQPVAPILTSQICLCWTHLAAYASTQVAAFSN